MYLRKQIRLTEQDLHRLIKESVMTVLKEENEMVRNSHGETLELSNSFREGLYDLGNMYRLFKGFVNEYDAFAKTLVSTAGKLGLKLKNFSTEKYFSLEDAFDGHSYNFEFDFIITPNVGASAVDGEFEENLNHIYDEFANAIGKPSYGALTMYTTENGIVVYYSFRMRNTEH